MDKPQLFIASSEKNIEIARAIQDNLKDVAFVTIWDQGVFALSNYILESILEKLDEVDFGAFILAADDVIEVDGEKQTKPRDNVVFELGLCIGRLGRDRSFLIAPDNLEKVDFLSDISGVVFATFDSNHFKNDPIAALGNASNQMRRVIKEFGLNEFSHYSKLSAGKLERVLISHRMADSPFQFHDLLSSASSEMLLAAQNHHYILVSQYERTKKMIFDFLRRNKGKNRIRFIICDKDNEIAGKAWAESTVVRYDDYIMHLTESTSNLLDMIKEAREENLNLQAKSVPYVLVSATFVDPDESDEKGSGKLVFVPNTMEKSSGLRPCYYISRKSNPDVFNYYWRNYEHFYGIGKALG